MTKTWPLHILALASVLTILAIAAAPAAAEFEADQPNTTQGAYQLSAGTSAILTSGTFELKCSELARGVWHEQTKFTKVVVTGGVTKVEQDLTKRGPHQQITGQFTKCFALGTLAATVNSTCSLQVEQHSSTDFRDAVKSRCMISIPEASCTITIPAGNPNTQLKEVKSINIEKQNKEDVSNVGGITSTVAGAGCAIGGFEGNKANKLKATGIAHSQKVI